MFWVGIRFALEQGECFTSLPPPRIEGNHTMADIIPFPTQRLTHPANDQRGAILSNQIRDGFLGGLFGKASKFDQMMEEIAELYEDPPQMEFTCCRFDLPEGEDAEALELEFASLSELVVFSPEIQKDDFKASEPAEGLSGAVRWGDVFLKSGDEYSFLFTVYTDDYVSHQLVSYGEKIVPSPKDVILRKEHLSPPDIIRAVIKWANLYSPGQKGKQVRLESDAVLQDLICDPGIEVVVADDPS
jgi:hypothetical protein